MNSRTFDYKDAHANGFYHEWCIDTTATLVEKVDRFFGGWPIEYNTLMFYHGSGQKARVMEFRKNGFDSGWWTVVLTDIECYRFKAGGLAPDDARMLARNIRSVLAKLEAI